MTMTELQDRYFELTHERADRRWKEATLATKIEETEAHLARQAEAAAARKKEAEIAEEMRQTLIRQRGDFDTFYERTRRTDGDEYRLRQAIVWAKRSIDRHETETAKFADGLLKNPLYAMSWSNSYFQHAGQYTVAMQIKSMFEGGVTYQDMTNTALDYALRGARHPARSTSPTSNLAEQEELKAWAEVAAILRGHGLF